MDGLGDDLARRGIAAWNIEYRRVGEEGGGWPGTLIDAARATDRLADLGVTHRLDLLRTFGQQGEETSQPRGRIVVCDGNGSNRCREERVRPDGRGRRRLRAGAGRRATICSLREAAWSRSN